jgi:phosphoglucosamine mutase
MTNYGFHREMSRRGIEVAQTRVGDRYVLEELRRRDWSLGGEQSGHLIWADYAPSGDGIAASLLALTALGERQLAEVEPFERLPQRLENVEIADREAIERAERLWQAVDEENSRLDGRGRVLVRPSGTEPLLRVMVEAPEEAERDAVLTRLVDLAKAELG